MHIQSNIRSKTLRTWRSSARQRILVAGFGNLLLKDDGVGVHAIRALRQDPLPGVIAVEVGTAVLDALHLFEWAERILAIDAMQAAGPAGTIYVVSKAHLQEEQGVQKSTVNVYGRITSMSRRVVNVFEDVVSTAVPSELLQEAVKGSAVYGKSIPLPPGVYRLNIVAKDVIGGNMNNYELALRVPRFDDETLSSSSLILADVLEKVPTRSIGTGQFVIGTSKVRPRVDETFRQTEKMGVYIQLYNFGPDEKTQKPNGAVEYEVTKDGTNEKIFDFAEEINGIEGASANQVTIEKLLPLQNLKPGTYTLRMKIVDRNRNQTITTSAGFKVS